MPKFLLEPIHLYADQNLPTIQDIDDRFKILSEIMVDNKDDVYDIEVMIDDVHISETLSIFVNDYKFVIHRMLLRAVHTKFNNYTNSKINISVILESQCYNLDIIQSITHMLQLQLTPFKRRGKVTQLGFHIDGEFMGLYHVVESKTVPTCLCYSLCLAYQRMSKHDGTIVIIEKQFKPIENKVEKILRKISQVSITHNCLSIAEWIWI